MRKVTAFGNLSLNLMHELQFLPTEKSKSRQRSGNGAIRKKFPLQKPRWEKTKLTISYLY